MLLVIKLVSNLIKGKTVYTDSLITSSRLFTSKSGEATGPKYSIQNKNKNGELNDIGKCELFSALICESYEIYKRYHYYIIVLKVSV